MLTISQILYTNLYLIGINVNYILGELYTCAQTLSDF